MFPLKEKEMTIPNDFETDSFLETLQDFRKENFFQHISQFSREEKEDLMYRNYRSIWKSTTVRTLKKNNTHNGAGEST